MEHETATEGNDTAQGETVNADDGAKVNAEGEKVAASAGADRSSAAVRVAVSLLCVIAGAVGGVLVAHSLASRDEAAGRSQFRSDSALIASQEGQALQREQDLTTAASSYFAGEPKASSSDLAAWSLWAHLANGYPELQRLALLRISGEARQRCLTSAELTRGHAVAALPVEDFCAQDRRLLSSRDSAKPLVRIPARRQGIREVFTPVYRGLAPPAGTGARRRAFVGWVREVFDEATAARVASLMLPHYAIKLRYGPQLGAVASYGVPPQRFQSTNVPIGGYWGIESFAPAPDVPLFGKGRVWALAAGLLVGVLMGLLALLTGSQSPPLETEESAEEPAAPLGPEPQAEALYDPLTGLPGRALTLDRASQALARAGRQSGTLVGALVIDVDWLKDVNEKLGMGAGDQALAIVAERLQAAMRAEDTVGRLGEDEFAVLVECTARSVRMDALAQRVLDALHRPVELEGFGPSFVMTVSIGVAFGRYETPEDLLRDADLALESAKAAGKDRYALFNASTRTVIEGSAELEAELNAALEERQLELLFEPIWDLGSGGVVGFEAQPRWLHPKRGPMPAEQLALLVQGSGLTVPIDRWTIEQACASAAAWEVQGRRVGVSVKLSGDQLSRDGLAVDVRRALQQSGLDPSLLTLQIAETAVMSDLASAAERLHEIKQLGVRLAIEDFGGSGYAYHSDLRKLPLDSLRVDRSALTAAEDAEYGDWLFEAILMVGHELSLAVVAKGVESEAELAAVRSRGCGIAQGTALGAAVPADAALALCDVRLAPAEAPPAPAEEGSGEGEDANASPQRHLALPAASLPGS